MKSFSRVWLIRARRSSYRRSAIWVILIAGGWGLPNGALPDDRQVPTAQQLQVFHKDLKSASAEVQGELRTYRAETVIPAAHGTSPSQLKMPLVREAKLWRSPSRFRADFTLFDDGSTPGKNLKYAVAMDAGRVFEYADSGLPVASLRICDQETQEAATSMLGIQVDFLHRIDCLWSIDGRAVVDLLQRPDVTLARSPEGNDRRPIRLTLATKEGGQTAVELGSTVRFAVMAISTVAGSGDVQVKVERQIEAREMGGRLLPTRVADVVSTGAAGGYTEVVELDLRPLEPNSPIAQPISAASFQNMGNEYQVYEFKKSGKQDLAGRFQRAPIALEGSVSRGRVYFLWMNAFAIGAVIIYLTFRRIRRSMNSNTARRVR